MTNILLIAGRYQLGNNEGLFQDAHYVGYGLELPFRKTWIDTDAKEIGFVFHTTDVETWGDWKGHRVAINGQEIGRLKDPSDTYGPAEVFTIKVPTATLEKILSGKDNFVLSVELERQPTQPGLSDKLVLTRIETDGTLALRVEVIQPGCGQSDSRHDAAAEVRRVPPTQNCAKISGCIGSRIPMGERGPRPIQ